MGHLWQYSTYEAGLTMVLMFGVATVVRWVIGESPVSRAVPDIHLKLVVVGVAVGLLLSGLILSPLGRASGGHMNPAISLAMWPFGVFPGRGVLPYWAAQLAGSVLGVVLARLVWGAPVARPPVAYSALRPAPGWSNASLFAAETASMAVIVVLVGAFLSAPRLAPRVPWLVGGLIGVGIVGLGTVTGPCVNPARQFGPAVLAGQSDFLATYLIAPMVGAVVAAVLLGRFHRCRLLTHRLCGPRRSTDAVQDERRSGHRG
ncbi:aquaporin [Actinopolymorpha rutila]|uniref:Glycerol uptake facilitator protein/aquaporin Z n=1 Tax=Actinopolymorpha rutila TaxID=446787 RepID=A0A852ZPX4_9ACTN|nr:glycerol uptake facilitator protein/aquaporin Z [Actinopolymorpha rutila]